HRGGSQQRGHLLTRQHLGDPHHTGALLLQAVHAGGDLGGQFGGVRCTGAQHQLHLRGQCLGGGQQVGEPLLPGDPPHEDHRRACTSIPLCTTCTLSGSICG